MTRSLNRIIFGWLLVFLFITLSVPLMVFATDPTSAAPNYVLNTTTNVSETYLSNEGHSNEAYTRLMAAYASNEENVYTNAGGTYTVNGIYSNGFPAYYGGAYINTDGHLVVLLTNGLYDSERIAAMNAVLEITQNNDIIFSTTENSYRELVTAMSEISEYIESPEYVRSASVDEIPEISVFAIDDYSNNVVVTVEKDVDAVSSYTSSANYAFPFDSDLVIYKERNGNATAIDTTLSCGDYVRYNSGFSAGFPAHYTNSLGNTISGFVTCAHGFYGVTTNVIVTNGSAVIGNLDATRNQFSGTLDAAFVHLNSTTSFTNTADGYTIDMTGYNTPAEGGLVYMSGATSEGVLIGYVDHVTCACTVSSNSNSEVPYSVELSDMYYFSYVAQPGDSGGLTFSRITGTATHRPVAIQCASTWASDGDEDFTLGIKVGNILQTFGLTLG